MIHHLESLFIDIYPFTSQSCIYFNKNLSKENLFVNFHSQRENSFFMLLFHSFVLHFGFAVENVYSTFMSNLAIG
jgi:hypothetical protein